jgi:uncharacterized membrane protein
MMDGSTSTAIPTLMLWLHILAAVAWVGGMIFLTLVVVPVERRIQDPRLRFDLVNRIGIRFKYLGWASIAILIVTGTYNTLYKVSSWDQLMTTGYGKTLLIKLAIVAFMFSLSIAHDFFLGPKLVEKARERKKIKDLAYIVTILARGNLILALLVILLAVSLRTGGIF